MKTNQSSLNRLVESCLPENIFLCYKPFQPNPEKAELDLLQNQSGRDLVKKMSHHFLEEDEVQIYTVKNEKPEVYCAGREISASFSHTSDGVAGAISADFNVGCDMEIADRTVHPKLMKRMRHEREESDLYEEIDVIRIWTLKEAALKMIGTGLRTPMKSVQIKIDSPGLFRVHFSDGKEAKICSFRHQNHFISVCYRALELP